MDEAIACLKEKWIEIKKRGYIESVTEGDNGVGRTLEYVLGVDENNFELPDYFNIELKAKRSYKNDHVTLFAITPNKGKSKTIEEIKERYGYPDRKMPNHKVINNAVLYQRKTEISYNYYFTLGIDEKEKIVYLESYDKGLVPVDRFLIWTFEELEQKINRKIKTMAFFEATSQKWNGTEYFKYTKMTIYQWKDFETFIELIKQRKIGVSIRISVFRHGPKEGKTHDRGTSFYIEKDALEILYNKYEL